eukprot:353903_1
MSVVEPINEEIEISHVRLSDIDIDNASNINEEADIERAPTSYQTNSSLLYEIKTIFFQKKLLSVLPLVFLWVVAGYIPATFMPAWSAKYFANCTEQQIKDNICVYNYPLSARWNAIFGAIGGVISFLFGAMLGDISDSFGRKPFLYMNVITSALQYAPLIIWPHMWIKLVFMIPSGLNCSDNSLTPSMVTYIADIMDEKSRTTAYSITYSIAALGLIVGTFISILVEIYFYTELNFIIITIINIIQIFYVYFFVQESLSPQLRDRKIKIFNYNPLKPLLKMRAHPVVGWISIIQFFASLPETGVLEIAITFILDQMGINNDIESTKISSLFLISAAIGLLIGNLYILPKLKQLNFSDVNILAIGCELSIVAFIFMSLISFYPHLSFVFLSGILLTLGMISFPSANGLVTKYLNEKEQGIGFGVIFAVRAITWIVAPILFATMYELLKKINLEYITFLVGALLGVIELFIILYPLKKLLILIDETGKIYSFNDQSDDETVKNETMDEGELILEDMKEYNNKLRRSSTAPHNNSFTLNCD